MQKTAEPSLTSLGKSLDELKRILSMSVEIGLPTPSSSTIGREISSTRIMLKSPRRGGATRFHNSFLLLIQELPMKILKKVRT